MEIFLLLVLVLYLIIPWLNMVSLRNAKNRIDDLEAIIDHLRYRIDSLQHDLAKKSEASSDSIAVRTSEEDVDRVQASVPQSDKSTQENIKTVEPARTHFPVTSAPSPAFKAEESVPDQAPVGHRWELNIATKLPVWIGAFSLICAAFFLIKHSIEAGWLSPEVRCVLGSLFGCALIYVGTLASKRTQLANHARIGQGLMGAGIVSLYFTFYAATTLIGLIPSIAGFGLMAALTGVATILSLRHGQVIAIFALLGGLLTPVLIRTDDPNVTVLTLYLFVLFAGLFRTFLRKGWILLAIGAVVGIFAWALAWLCFAYNDDDALAFLLLAIGACAVVLSMTARYVCKSLALKSSRRMKSIHGLNLTALGLSVLTVIAVSLQTTLSLFDWALWGLVSAALMGLTVFQPSIYSKALAIKVGVSFLMLFIWAKDAVTQDALIVILSFAALYVGGATYLISKFADKLHFVVLQTLSALILFLISHFTLDLVAPYNSDAFWAALSLIGAVIAARKAQLVRAGWDGVEVIGKMCLACYCLVASAFISIGLAIILPVEALAVAIALQVAATSWVMYKTQIGFMTLIVRILLFVFVALSLGDMNLLASMAFKGLLLESPGASLIDKLTVDWPLLSYGIPALSLGFAALFLTKARCDDGRLLLGLKLLSGALAMGLVYTLVRMGFALDQAAHPFADPASFIERAGVNITWAVLSVIGIMVARRRSWAFVKAWCEGVLLFVIARLVYYDVLFANPIWNDTQQVGSLLLLNGVTLTYGFMVALSLWALRAKIALPNSWNAQAVYSAVATVGVFLLVSLNVRQGFHGDMLYYNKDPLITAELYSYSVAWLLTGILSLAYGIALSNQAARFASLGFMLVTIIKVFFIDASQLEGALRVASFFGLGVALIGLSAFYTKFVFKGAEPVKGQG